MKSEDPKWDETVLQFRYYMAQYKTLRDVARSIGFSTFTLRKILDGNKPSLICQIKVEAWVKRNTNLS